MISTVSNLSSLPIRFSGLMLNAFHGENSIVFHPAGCKWAEPDEVRINGKHLGRSALLGVISRQFAYNPTLTSDVLTRTVPAWISLILNHDLVLDASPTQQPSLGYPAKTPRDFFAQYKQLFLQGVTQPKKIEISPLPSYNQVEPATELNSVYMTL